MPRVTVIGPLASRFAPWSPTSAEAAFGTAHEQTRTKAKNSQLNNSRACVRELRAPLEARQGHRENDDHS